MSSAVVVGLDLQAQFEREYCPPLDTATLLAIIQDYDLSETSQYQAAREILDLIKESAAEEEASGFDPSGSSGTQPAVREENNSPEEIESVSAKSHPGWASTTDDTSVSQGMSVLDLDGLEFPVPGPDSTYRESSQTYDFGLEGLGDESKEAHLVAIFPALRPFDIRWTLKKYKGDANLAIDELMTQSFLEESGTRQRGIEAFSENDAISRPKKKNKGRKRKGRQTDESNTTVSPIPVDSKWEKAGKEVDFISSKTGMPKEQVTSLYHKNGGSINSTISAIIEAHASLAIDSEDDAVIQLQAYELSEQFPSISPSDILILLQITHPSQAYAQDLAQALVARPSTSTKSSIQIELRHAPIDLEAEARASEVKPYAFNAVHSGSSSTYVDPTKASEEASQYRATRDKAFTQASAAYRRGKSDHLMGGAAAYYAEIGRDFDARAKSAESAAADALVATQSSWDRLDLHGVNVKDGVRITREKVTAWWHNQGDARLSGRAGSYKIVTGLGNHSKEGIARLGPAVAKMLIREGWKVEVGQGAVVVTGVVAKPMTTKKK